MSHGHARTTFHGWKLIVERWRSGWKKAHIAAAMGICRKCVRARITRFEGEAGLVDRSSRPHTSPRPTPAEMEERIVEVRSRERRGPDSIGAGLGAPARTVSRVLLPRGQPWLAAPDPMTGEVIRYSKVTAVRYERSRPGELVHMDVKKLARIPESGGWRAHGRAAASTTGGRATKVGYDYVHSLVDNYCRLAYSEILTDEEGRHLHGLSRSRSGLLRRPWHRPHRTRDDRQRLGLSVLAARGHHQAGRPAESSSSPTASGRTARSDDSTAPWPPNGLTGRSSPATTSAPPPWPPGSSTTTSPPPSALGKLSPLSRLAPT